MLVCVCACLCVYIFAYVQSGTFAAGCGQACSDGNFDNAPCCGFSSLFLKGLCVCKVDCSCQVPATGLSGVSRLKRHKLGAGEIVQ